ncbi:MAG: hypothetical protein ABIW33_09430 [Sphingomicrobium sp.]
MGGFVSADYRVYRLDGTGRIAAGDWIDAASDDEALRAARETRASGRIELWHGKRLVARIDSD